MLGAEGYIPGRSCFANATLEQLQEGVGRLAGHGEVRDGRNETWSSHEIVEESSFTGIAVDWKSGDEVPTRSFLIHYWRIGAHIVPADPKPTNQGGMRRRKGQSKQAGAKAPA